MPEFGLPEPESPKPSKMFYSFDPARKWRVHPVYTGDARLADMLREMEADPLASGYSDVGVRNLLYTTVLNLSPRRVLEIGCHIGVSAAVIGSALRLNEFGKLLSLEPNPSARERAGHYLGRLGLDDHVKIIPLLSTDAECRAELLAEAPFELIYVDGSHYYADAYSDIVLAAELLHDNGFIILHDTGRVSADIDKTGKGGVRQALFDFVRNTPAMHVLYFDHPLWMNPCGVAMLSRQILEPAPRC